MKKIFTFIALCLIVTSLFAEKVQYFEDFVLQHDETYIKLSGGSIWRLSAPMLPIMTPEVLIVFHKFFNKQNQLVVMPVLYNDIIEIPLFHISGAFPLRNGSVINIYRNHGDGAILEADNGLLLFIATFDRYHTGYWLTPYKALIDENGRYMWNLSKGKKVSIESIRK